MKARFSFYKQLLGLVRRLQQVVENVEAEQSSDFRVLEQHFAQLFGAQIGVNATRNDDAAASVRLEQRETAFDEQLYKLMSVPAFLPLPTEI